MAQIETTTASVATQKKEAAPSRLTRARRAAILKALADPNRFELVERIAKANCPMGCSQAQAALDIAPATLSHHIKELESAGLIRVEKAGKFHYLHLKREALAAVSESLGMLAKPACPQG
ncbi:MAG: helix-turn-helix transcriptional regulator [Acidobacteriota bacterium]|nr:helix-turn-helix transcriptional regulator [Acidobacteriota bacterium]